MITLEANYAKKIGLPGYSSHQFSVTLRSELTDVSQVQVASAKLYAELQASVDRSIRQVGFLPGLDAGKPEEKAQVAEVSSGEKTPAAEAASLNQQAKIRRLIDAKQIPKAEVERLAQRRYRKGVRQLSKVEASGLIDDLVEYEAPKARAK